MINQQDKKELLKSAESLIEGTNVLSGQIVEDTQAPLFVQFDRLKFGFALFTNPLVNNSLFVYKTEKLPATLEKALEAPVKEILGVGTKLDKNRFLNKKVFLVRADSTPSKYVVAKPNNFSQEISIGSEITGLDSLSEKNYQQILSFINLQDNKYGYLAYGYPSPGPLDPDGVVVQNIRKNLYSFAPVITDNNINGLRIDRDDSINLVYSYTPSDSKEGQVILKTPINLVTPLGPLDKAAAAEKQNLAIVNYLKIKEGLKVDELTGLDGLRQEGQKIQVLASEVKKKLDGLLDESTEAVDYYMNNMFKMSGLIKKLKDEQW